MRGEAADPALHLPLLLLRGLVVAVLRQVAQLAGHLDLAGDLDPAASGQVLVLGPEALVGLPGELGRVSHGRSSVVRRPRIVPGLDPDGAAP